MQRPILESYAEFGLKGFTTEMRTGIPPIAQMKKSTELKTPVMFNNGFTVADKDPELMARIQ